MILVTKPYLPDIKAYQQYVEKIWASGWITNNGALVQELEAKLQDTLQVPNCIFLNNGTIALQIAIQALDIQGEIITTPFSYVATTSTILWEKCTPVFADIEPDTLCIDPNEIEALITDRTSAIMATHVFGNPCDVEALEQIAQKHQLKIIYDAAHAFGVTYKGQSILTYGDISTLSFHATKLFHTVEGGAMICKDSAVFHKAEYMRRFGHDGPYAFHGVGVNGKNSEFHAAMGLCVLKDYAFVLNARRKICERYDTQLAGTSLQFLSIRKDTSFNYAYYPIIFKDEATLLKTMAALEAADIFPRRYFYPALNTLDYLDKKVDCPVAERVAQCILCLPLYVGLETSSVDYISQIIKDHL